MSAAAHTVRLDYDADQRRDFARLVGIVRRERGIATTEEAVLQALRDAAARA